MPPTSSTWTRPDLSDVENFRTAPIADRAAAFAALREREPVPFFAEPEFAYLPRGALLPGRAPGTHEMAVMFRELLTRVPEIHATAEPRRLQSMFINGIKSLPVSLGPVGLARSAT